MSIQDYFNQTFSIYSKTTRDKYGKPSFSLTATIKGRLQEGEEFKREFNEDVETIMADATAYIPQSASINIEDVVEDTSDNTRYNVLDIYEARNRTSVHHKKLYLKKTIR